MIIKIANTGKSEKNILFNLNLKGLPNELKGKRITLKAGLGDENTLDEPFLVQPSESSVSINSSDFHISVPSESFEVLVLDL
jgi:alpha-L-arabinofuranosidase